ncbi:hypothetical protein PHISCL_03292 [Aspergillus sclerotialis]|uniref:Uncharacterized protein n=1 Tax=Aspergillus sclerotialis TaxID=2070753 RepID=A0A3A2ZYB7_9EURO|nr:hypothetical protein PHISCL_03292 [Aspergillus sclerotialis]
MASRRGNQTYAEAVASPAPEKPTDSDVSPAVPTDVIVKLLGFTVAMIVAPISMYFLTIDAIFNGSSTYAGITAAVTANVILGVYIFVAWQEDKGDRAAEQKEKEKKGQ